MLITLISFDSFSIFVALNEFTVTHKKSWKTEKLEKKNSMKLTKKTLEENEKNS